MTALGDAPPLAWERLLEAGEIDERLVLTSAEEARAAASMAQPADLAPELVAALARGGIERPYSHQLDALPQPAT